MPTADELARRVVQIRAAIADKRRKYQEIKRAQIAAALDDMAAKLSAVQVPEFVPPAISAVLNPEKVTPFKPVEAALGALEAAQVISAEQRVEFARSVEELARANNQEIIAPGSIASPDPVIVSPEASKVFSGAAASVQEAMSAALRGRPWDQNKLAQDLDALGPISGVTLSDPATDQALGTAKAIGMLTGAAAAVVGLLKGGSP